MGWSMSSSVLHDTPDLSAPFSEFAAAYAAPPRLPQRAAMMHTMRADASTQTVPDPTDGLLWELKAKELKQANARLRTALMAAALDPEVDLRSIERGWPGGAARLGEGISGLGGFGVPRGKAAGKPNLNKPQVAHRQRPQSARGALTREAPPGGIVKGAAARPASASAIRGFDLPSGLREWPPMA